MQHAFDGCYLYYKTLYNKLNNYLSCWIYDELRMYVHMYIHYGRISKQSRTDRHRWWSVMVFWFMFSYWFKHFSIRLKKKHILCCIFFIALFAFFCKIKAQKGIFFKFKFPHDVRLMNISFCDWNRNEKKNEIIWKRAIRRMRKTQLQSP